MGCKKCNKRTCGCEDSALNTIPSCTPNPDCVQVISCAEYIESACVIFADGLNTSEGDFAEGISLRQYRQMRSIQMQACLLGTFGCYASFDVYSISATATTITIGWAAAFGTPVEYQVQYKLPLAGSFTLFSTQDAADPRTATITGLTTGTTYFIKVTTINDPCECDSAVIIVTTN